MSDIEEPASEEQSIQEPISKLAKYGRITIYASLIILWIVTAVLGIIDLIQGKTITETPWIIFGLVLTVPIVLIVILPLFKSLKTDVKGYKERKEQEEKDSSVTDNSKL